MEAEDIAKILAGLGALSWVGTTINGYLKTRKSDDTEKLAEQRKQIQSEEELKHLKERIETLLEDITNLKAQIESFKNMYELEKADKQKALQQLASINIAFDIIYIQLKNILGGDEEHSELLNQLKGYIDQGTSNM